MSAGLEAMAVGRQLYELLTQGLPDGLEIGTERDLTRAGATSKACQVA